MKRRQRAWFAGYLPWRPLLPAALVAAAGFTLELTVLAGSAAGAMWSVALALAVGTLAAWGEARGADRGRVELALQLNGLGDARLALGPRAPLFLLAALVLDGTARALGLAAQPPGSLPTLDGPSHVDALALGALAFLATRLLARVWTLARGDSVQRAWRDHLFAVPGALACAACALCAARGWGSETRELWVYALPAGVLLWILELSLARRFGTDVFAVLDESSPRL